MKKKKENSLNITGKAFPFFSLLAVGLLSAAFPVQATDSSARSTGMLPLRADELKEMTRPEKRVVQVNPNKIGLARMQQERAAQGLPQEMIDGVNFLEGEFVHASDPKPAATTRVLPSYVNNSTLPSFPPIGDQGNQGSCVAWASTYYQASHETALAKGLNNKNSNIGVLSPKWTYNMINSGYDAGAYVSDAYQLLSQNGAASIASFPYDGNYVAWDLNAPDWVAATSNRLSPAKYFEGVNTSPQNLTQIKQALNNGHVLTFATYFYGWVFTTIESNPNTQNRAVGQQAAYWVNAPLGGHMVTVVGYDDNVWVDVNQNGEVDPGEMGAFLVANSWGSDWGNNGFVWISYDAFLSASAVTNGPSHGRISAANASSDLLICAVAKAANYTPQLVAQFTLEQTMRDQIKIAGGASSTTQKTPSKFFQSGALFYQGGGFGFNGQPITALEAGTFALDLTDFVTTTPGEQRYYLMVCDSVAGHPTVLNSFSLVNPKTGVVAQDPGVLPAVVDNSKITHYVDYTPLAAAESTAPTQVAFSAPIAHSSLKGLAPLVLNISQPDQVSRVEFYAGNTLIGTDTGAPYVFMWDTTTVSNRIYKLSAVVYDLQNNSTTTSVRVRVRN
jgi:C1A family cysteine protease